MSQVPVWFLAHPVAGDEKYSYDDNIGSNEEETVGHIIQCLTMCFRAGLYAIAPYHTLCLALDDADENDRTMGTITGLSLIRSLKRVILSGHKISRGMEAEVAACLDCGGQILNMVGVADKDFVYELRNPARLQRHLKVSK